MKSIKAITLAMIVLSLFVSCSSTSEKSASIGNLDQDDKMLGEPLPEWVDFEGVKNGMVYAVGEAEYSATKREQLVKSAAQHNAKMRAVERMPTDYKTIVQNSLSSASEGEYNRFEIGKGELQGLKNVSVSRKYTTCRKIIRNTGDDQIVNRICYSRASVPLKDLNRSVAMTIKRKYGEKVEKKFSDIMEDQVRKELAQ